MRYSTTKPECLAAVITIAGGFSIFDIVKFAALRAHNNVTGVSNVFGQEVTGEQVYGVLTVITLKNLDPKEVFDLDIRFAIDDAMGPVQAAYLLFKRMPEPAGSRSILVEI
jgi:hypothetical protein